MDTAVDARVTYIIITINKSITVDICVGSVFLTTHRKQGLVHLMYAIDFSIRHKDLKTSTHLKTKSKARCLGRFGSPGCLKDYHRW